MNPGPSPGHSPEMRRKASIGEMETNKFKTYDHMHRTSNCTFMSRAQSLAEE